MAKLLEFRRVGANMLCSAPNCPSQSLQQAHTDTKWIISAFCTDTGNNAFAVSIFKREKDSSLAPFGPHTIVTCASFCETCNAPSQMVDPCQIRHSASQLNLIEIRLADLIFKHSHQT